LIPEGYEVRTMFCAAQQRVLFFAAGAVAVKLLASKDEERIGIIGAGLQARRQLEYLQTIHNVNGRTC
jgi:hypothetical protein